MDLERRGNNGIRRLGRMTGGTTASDDLLPGVPQKRRGPQNRRFALLAFPTAKQPKLVEAVR